MANLAVRPNWRGTGNNNNAVNFYQVNLGKKSHAGKILGGGTSADPVLSSTASEKFESFYGQNSATSGTSVGTYWKLTTTGVLGGGCAARFYAYTNADSKATTGATLMGAQITAETGVAGRIGGLLVGCRSQVAFAASAGVITGNGTVAGGQSELYFTATAGNDSNTDIRGLTHCLHRFICDGDTTARAKVNYLFDIVNVTVGTSATTDMVNTANITPSHCINVMINGAQYGILLDKV